MQSTEQKPRLLSAQACIRELFPDRQPSLRTFQEWQKRGLIPFKKIGHFAFFDPEEVRKSLDQHCTVQYPVT
jgi:hypothetical protein